MEIGSSFLLERLYFLYLFKLFEIFRWFLIYFTKYNILWVTDVRYNTSSQRSLPTPQTVQYCVQTVRVVAADCNGNRDKGLLNYCFYCLSLVSCVRFVWVYLLQDWLCVSRDVFESTQHLFLCMWREYLYKKNILFRGYSGNNFASSFSMLLLSSFSKNIRLYDLLHSLLCNLQLVLLSCLYVR